jgi:hypothetical protein
MRAVASKWNPGESRCNFRQRGAGNLERAPHFPGNERLCEVIIGCTGQAELIILTATAHAGIRLAVDLASHHNRGGTQRNIKGENTGFLYET